MTWFLSAVALVVGYFAGRRAVKLTAPARDDSTSHSHDAHERRAEVVPTQPFRNSLIAAIHGEAEPKESQADDRRLLVDVLRMNRCLIPWSSLSSLNSQSPSSR